MTDLLQIPTHIISGFLGVGKTTAIIDLFSQKPATEKWAVLVNEFGKIGIDRHIYQAHGITVKEIPGGCMCCAQGVALQVTVNQLLRETRPDRLIIESSGAGHPQGVLNTLKGEGFRQSLDLKAGICLIDPEHLLIDKYQKNNLFQQQIKLADVLIANKTDLASEQAIMAYNQLTKSFMPQKLKVATTIHGRMDPDWLNFNHQAAPTQFSFQSNAEDKQQQTWYTRTFQFDEVVCFDIDAIQKWLESIRIIRLKGLIRGADGFCLLNHSNGFSSVMLVKKIDVKEQKNYVEIIFGDSSDGAVVEAIEQGLKSCQLDSRISDHSLIGHL